MAASKRFSEPVRKRSSMLWRDLTSPSAALERREERLEARMLASVLLSMVLLGILVALLQIVTDPPEARYDSLGGAVMTIVFLMIPFLLARSRLYRVAIILAIILFDIVAIIGFFGDQEAYFLAYFLIPILLSALFSSRRTAYVVTVVHLALALLVAVVVLEQGVIEVVRSSMLALLYVTVLILAWSRLHEERWKVARQEMLEERAAVLQGQQSQQQDAVTPGREDTPLNALTAREYELLQLMVNGLSNAEIASALSIARQTVLNHARNIYRKLDVNRRVEAVLLALRCGMQPSPGALPDGLQKIA